MLGSTFPSDSLDRECWYVAYTYGRHEKAMAEQCGQRGIRAFLPLYAARRRWNKRRVEVLLPLFPSYVFVRIALAQRLRVLAIPGVASLVSFKGIPAVIPDSQIDPLMKAVSLGRAEPHVYLQAGKRVRVTTGPLVGLEGMVLDIRNNVHVIVSFEWMSRSVAISLDAAEVELI